MASIIWIFVVMFVIHDAQSFFQSLPSLEEVKNRTRWCLGEGSHCPVNLYHSFSSCCKPYVCTEVPKTCEPAFILKFTHYSDHRCMLPSSNLTQVDREQMFQENINATDSLLTSDLSDEMIREVNSTFEITTLKFNTNETFVNDSNLGEYEDSYKNAVSHSNETYFESNETHSFQFHPKRSITKRSSENIEKSSSESAYTSEEAGDYNDSNSLESENSSLEISNVTLSSESESSETVSKMSKVLDSIEDNHSSVNNRVINNSRLEDDYFKNKTFLASTLIPETNNSDVSQEDWTSSEMTYDTRPRLHKIVTIHPLRLFETSVEVIKLNESAERSY